MSHELRTPLNAVIGFAEVIRDELLGPVGRKQYQEYAGDICKAGTHLLDLINDILSVSRIDLGKVRLNETELNLEPVIRSAMRLLGRRAEEKSITIAVDLAPNLPALAADERALKQVLVNLLTNAVKFSDEESRIVVSARENDGLVIAVTDSGIGIDAEILDKVKQPFFQAEAALERRFEGAGLGLAIADGLMQLHGGSLEIESVVGQGTTVTLRFPVTRICRACAA
jgi:signal transduction histidine kinase